VRRRRYRRAQGLTAEIAMLKDMMKYVDQEDRNRK
jgi:hypothetical protein